MHLSLLLLSSLLLPVGAAGKRDKISPGGDNYKHVDINAIFKALLSDDSVLYTNLCQIAYCHGQQVSDCYYQCEKLGTKSIPGVLRGRLQQLEETKQPDENIEICEKECNIDCAKDCGNECNNLCKHHFPNRKEYEAEFYDFVYRYKHTNYMVGKQ